ncbi:cbbX protein [Nannizzia gypsea CBS 118893]|uniref:CbbX protein n=1 Tax=Arthroderma gypseum (strain ATCC MYA-4604 / CBS 118893) TaxID=535722 RepID=E4V1U6_ARTGP|nr:cbbX protein [Nannizzia gypsea CBS 118893]EFR04011.1 cbbX protein [Nannizzia gypsea CBS 118893]
MDLMGHLNYQKYPSVEHELGFPRGSGEPEAQPKSRGRRKHNNYEGLKPSHSPAKTSWKEEKCKGAEDITLDTLMEMVGLEEVKEEFLSIRAMAEIASIQGTNIRGNRFNCAMLGNPGTGKTTVARLYAHFLASLGAISGREVEETTGSKLADSGIEGCEEHIERLSKKGGGILFIDEAYQLTADHSSRGGLQALDYLLTEAENLVGKVVFVVAGYNKEMETFFGHNPGLRSRFPYTIQFSDFGDDDLMRIFALKVEKKWQGRMEVEKGPGGLYCRIVARRIGRGRGRRGFGNARTVENCLAQISRRQASRLAREKGQKNNDTDVMMLTKEDLLGPDPSIAIKKCKAWGKLQELIGLKAVKDAVNTLRSSIQINYQRELREEPIIEFGLNRVFLGNPGTGKTTVAKLYGEILKHLGILSDGEVVLKKPVDFIGQYLGESEEKTQAILEATVGKVLVIDEFYSFFSDEDQSSFSTAVIDTIVAEVQSSAGDDRCILILGYKENMEKMFQRMNPGLSRRFPLDSAFVFEDFTDGELRQILDLKLKSQGLRARSDAVKVAMGMLRRARNKPHFGNAGEVDNILNNAKTCQIKRTSGLGSRAVSPFLAPQDFDQDHSRATRASETIREMFRGMVGCEGIISKLESYQKIAEGLESLGMDISEQIPFSFLFRGPPGTGKTTVAKKMGRIYYDLGILATPDVEECSTSHMIAEYVGQTGPKTRRLLEKSSGKVLLIDEAYRLVETGSGHDFAKQALDELVNCMTEAKFSRKLVIILAGYDADINRLMDQNPGLTSRFPEAFVFGSLRTNECIELMCKELQKFKHKMTKNVILFDMLVLENPSPQFHQTLADLFNKLGSLPNWASARDVQTVARNIFNKALLVMNQKRLCITEDVVIGELKAMIDERSDRAQSPSPCPPVAPKARQQRSRTTHQGTAGEGGNISPRRSKAPGPYRSSSVFECRQSAPYLGKKIEATTTGTVDSIVGASETPNCWFGAGCTNMECPFVHYTRPCRRGSACTQPDCTFRHPNAACRYMAKCTNPGCPFRHLSLPRHVSEPTAMLDRSWQKRLPEYRYTAGCTNMECIFQHPVPICPRGSGCRTDGRVLRHPSKAIDCRHGSECINLKCSFKHP